MNYFYHSQSVMATDIADKELKALRDNRWEKAFKKGKSARDSKAVEENPKDAVHRKATIVIEQYVLPSLWSCVFCRFLFNLQSPLTYVVFCFMHSIIQASDISHTMQHWHVYRHWNQNLFEELYIAYLNDRLEKDPAEFWYKGECKWFS